MRSSMTHLTSQAIEYLPNRPTASHDTVTSSRQKQWLYFAFCKGKHHNTFVFLTELASKQTMQAQDRLLV